MLSPFLFWLGDICDGSVRDAGGWGSSGFVEGWHDAHWSSTQIDSKMSQDNAIAAISSNYNLQGSSAIMHERLLTTLSSQYRDHL